MRALGALFGALVVLLSYLTIRDAGHSRIAATLTALAICFGKLIALYKVKTRFFY